MLAGSPDLVKICAQKRLVSNLYKTDIKVNLYED